MVKNAQSNNLEKTLLFVLSLISVGLLVAIIYVWYTALGNTSKEGTKPGDFLKPEQGQSQKNGPDEIPSQATSSSQAQTQKTLSLVIATPSADEVISAKSAAVSGTTSANATVTITGGKDDVITTADASGGFTEPVNLNEGQNDLVVSAFDSNGNQTNQTVSVVYIP